MVTGLDWTYCPSHQQLNGPTATRPRIETGKAENRTTTLPDASSTGTTNSEIRNATTSNSTLARKPQVA